MNAYSKLARQVLTSLCDAAADQRAEAESAKASRQDCWRDEMEAAEALDDLVRRLQSAVDGGRDEEVISCISDAWEVCSAF